MPLVNGKAVLVSVDNGSTFDLLTNEIECVFTENTDTISALNKNTSGYKARDVVLSEWGIRVRGHVPTGTADPALESLATASRTQAKIDVKFTEPNPYETYTGTVVVQGQTRTAAAGDFYIVEYDLQGDGAYTPAATA